MISGSVIQDCYNILMSPMCVEGLLSLAFPNFYEKDASMSTKQLMPFKKPGTGKNNNDTNAMW